MTMSPASTGNGPVDVVRAIASMRTGMLIECEVHGAALRQLEDLAAIVPSVLGTNDLSPFDKVLGRLAGESSEPSLREVLMVSAEHVHVMRPLARKSGFALLAISPNSNSVGLVLSLVRQWALEIEAE